MRKCEYCGAEIKDGEKRCTHCGAPAPKAPEEEITVVPKPLNPEPRTMPAPELSEEDYREQWGRIRRFFRVGIVIVIVLFVCGAIARLTR